MRGRREDVRLVTGHGTYVTGQRREGMLHAGFVRSYLAHGTVDRVDVSAARTAPGIAGAFTAGDLDLADIPGNTGSGPEATEMRRPPLATDRVRYVGEPLAVVIGSSPAEVADAVELVELDLDPLPAATDPTAALTDEVVLHPGAGSNVVGRLANPDRDARPDLASWPVVAEVTVDNQRLAPVPIEPLGLLAEPTGDGGLVVHCGHQAPHRFKGQLARLLDIDPARIRVVVPDTGGAFGMKGMLFPEYPVVAAAARRLEQSVGWIATRTEELQGGTHGRGASHRVRLAGDRDGRIHALHIDGVADVGAYPHNGSQISLFTQAMAAGPYDIGDVLAETTIVVTNRAPVGSYRGAGRPEATYAIERGIEAFAREVGLDPVEVRRRNLIPADRLPHRTPTGALYDSGDYVAALDLALDLVDAGAVREEQRRRREAGEPPLGLGLGVFVERAGGAVDSTEYTRVHLDRAGRVIVGAGTAASGQGHDTVWARLGAGPLGVEADEVEVVTGDTGRVADGVGTYGSRSAQIGGSAIVRCADRVREQVLELAGELLEVAPDDLTLRDGRVEVVGAPSRAMALAAVAAEAAERGVELASEESYSPHAQTFPYGAAAAVVEVDLDTGRVQLERIVAVDDCGTVLDEQIVEGQVHGSLTQGIAQALYEAVVYDERGQLLTSTLTDYLAPSAADVPTIAAGRLVHPAPSNPLGVKGTGESGCLSAPPAIVNAALDALAPYGVTDLAMPLTPERVWRAVEAARPAGDRRGEARR